MTFRLTSLTKGSGGDPASFFNLTMTKGILISAWGKRGYIYAAYNLAFSIKHFNRRLPVYLYCEQDLLKSLMPDQQGVFDEIIPIDVSLLHEHEKNPAYIKVTAYDHLPFDYTLLLDVDALALQDLEPCMDDLIRQGGYFYSHILDLWTIDKGDNIPNMVWARANDIWEKYKFGPETILPATNSSFQFIKKGEDSKRLLDRMRKNMADPMPLDKLKTQWGASQPDELYLNVAMAQEGITGKPDREYMFMGNRLDQRPYHVLEKDYFILSIFGGKNFTKVRYTEWYDKKLVAFHRAHGKSAFYKYAYIVRDKHANTKPVKFSKLPSRHVLAKEVETNTLFAEGKSGEKIHLFSGWFKAKIQGRQREIDECLKRNLENNGIDKVFVVCETECEINHPKLVKIHVDERPTYNTFFAEIDKYADDDTISILCNGDIYFDEANVRKLKGINFSNRALALSRYEVDINGHAKLFNYEWSQDTWIVRGKPKAIECNSTLGVMACDNRFAFELKKAGYDVFNPSRDIATFHLHQSGVRGYNVNEIQGGDKMEVRPSFAKDILKKRMLIIQPGKVGDILLCAPMARFFSDEYFVDWHCPEKYHSLFNSLPYARPVKDFKDRDYDKILDLSFGLGGKPERWWQQNKARFNSFVEAKYELAGLPSQMKRDLRWIRNQDRENDLYSMVKIDEPYKLVHGSSDYGTPIQVEGNVVKFQPILDYTIFDWLKVIQNADEIHCIDSSLCNFVDVIPDLKAKLFYYPTDKVPNKWDETLLTKNWIRNEVSITA